MVLMARLEESDVRLFVEAIDPEDFGMYDGLADTVIRIMRDFQDALETQEGGTDR